MQLTSGQRDCTDLAFSADDTRIIFTARGDAARNVYEVRTLGGNPRLLVRAANGGRFSPDGKWLAYVALDASGGLRIASPDATGARSLGQALIDISGPVWSPDSRGVLVRAHADSAFEPDYWMVLVDGGAPINTGIIRKLREKQFAVINYPPAWVHDSLVFSAGTSNSVDLWRQRLTPSYEAAGDPERLTAGTDTAWFATAARGRLAFVSIHSDTNLWSVAVDTMSGMAHGPLRRLTRGPGILGFLSVISAVVRWHTSPLEQEPPTCS
jgi:Tol biopolymer transport system component